MYKKNKPYTYDMKKCVGLTKILFILLYEDKNAIKKSGILEKLKEDNTSINTIRFWLDKLYLSNLLERYDSLNNRIGTIDKATGKTIFYALSPEAKRLLNDCAKYKEERIFLINILVSFINCEKDYYENEKHILEYLYEKYTRQLENQAGKALLLEPTDKKLQKFFNNTTDDICLKKYHYYKLNYKAESKNTKFMFYIKSYIKPDGIYFLFHNTSQFKFIKQQDLKSFEDTHKSLLKKDIEKINNEIELFLENQENKFYEFRTIIIKTNKYIALKLTYQNINIKHIHHYNTNDEKNSVRIEITSEYSFIYSFLKINMDQISILKIDADLMEELKNYFNKAKEQLSTDIQYFH